MTADARLSRALMRQFGCGLTATLVAIFAPVSPVYSAESKAATHFSCTFDQGRTWSYEAGAIADTPANPLTFEISDIDLEAQTANLVVRKGESGRLRIIRALNANHFLEASREGFVNLTTIYDADPETGVYPAVHSRHQGVVGQPIFAQYPGTCRVEAAP